MDTAIFYPGKGLLEELSERTKRGRFTQQVERENAAAKRVCAGCPVREKCLDFALKDRTERFGVWGGMTYDERKREARRRREAARRRRNRTEYVA